MKLNCEVIQDLLPMYLDNVCSDQSRQIVEEHLEECEECRTLVNSTKEVRIPHSEPDKSDADNAVRKGFKKIRLRWWLSIILVIVLVPFACLGWNQYHNTGIYYTNIHEYYIGRAFMKQMQKGNYEKAYGYMDIDDLKQRWLECGFFEENELTDIREEGYAKFCEYADKIEELGGIEGCEYMGIIMNSFKGDGTPVYQLRFKIRFNGDEQIFGVNVSDDGVESFEAEGSFLTDVLAQFSIWSEYLWEEYEGCYFDPDLGKYVYPESED